MSFTCKSCAEPEQRWLFKIFMMISYGRCESCGKTRECVNL